MLHGLSGSPASEHVQSMLRAALALPARAAALGFRKGQGPPLLHHAGRSADVGRAVEHLLDGEPLLIVGLSLGGSLLLKWLAEQGEGAPARVAAAALCVPYDLAGAVATLDSSPLRRLYQASMVGALKAQVRGLLRRHPHLLDRRRVACIRTLAEFDEIVVAPLAGFASAADYWARCSTRGVLGRIRRPTLLLSARDDPFMRPEHLPGPAELASPWLRADFQDRGGHLGFLGPGLRPWSEERVMAWFRELLARPQATSMRLPSTR
ncbi:MAG TPA: alpha/beta fold hydrolase [Candidatus Nitrosotenuis sp.]|nr:alpha/beta fold hydrolase [Candidatus Nitrosotenuis sp.]